MSTQEPLPKNDELAYPHPDINIEVCELFHAVSRGDVDHEEAAARVIVILTMAYGRGHIDRARNIRESLGICDGLEGRVRLRPGMRYPQKAARS